MKKCCFIIPYFGKFNNYFPLFLKTCAYNSDFNWLVITDDETEYDYPENFQVVRMSFQELKKLVQSKFDFPIALEKPYKLCDYKPAYGYIFEEYLTDYKFWGHCDTDVLMGNLSKFLTNDMLNRYDKLFCLGHMTLYRNAFENNRTFMALYKHKYLYKDVFSHDEICWFDEEWKDDNNINQIFQSLGKQVFVQDLSLNFRIDYSQFVKTTYTGITTTSDEHGYETENPKRCIYFWEQGDIKRYFLSDGKLQDEEYAYVHLQKRKMTFDLSILNQDKIQIVANKFLHFNGKDITANNFNDIYRKCFNLQYWNSVLKPKILRLFSKL